MSQQEVNPNLSEKARRDLVLVQQAQSGDQTAFTKLMSRYKDTIHFMTLKLVHNETDAEDLTMESISRAFCNIHLYSPEYAFSTWLFRIATNNAIDYLRRQKVRKLNIAEPHKDEIDGENIDPVTNVAGDMLTPEETLVSEQRKRALREMVSKLKPKYAQLVELRYFQELSYEEISEELQLPLGTVKAQLSRARDMLNAMIAKYPELQ
ncbi:MAG: sigma-70 family RNA polymerase sigma factor [Salinivirgaceae bacterium]|nr:sigma-70 family RNA polymerase sigma factor [Salinivirgaceae bacterium]